VIAISVHSHWDSTVKAFDDTTRRLKDFGSDVNDETSKFFGNIADTAVSVPQSHWDATVQAFDNTGKKLREFGTDFRDGSTKFFNDLSHGSSNQSGAQSVIFNLYYVLALLLAAYAFN